MRSKSGHTPPHLTHTFHCPLGTTSHHFSFYFLFSFLFYRLLLLNQFISGATAEIYVIKRFYTCQTNRPRFTSWTPEASPPPWSFCFNKPKLTASAVGTHQLYNPPLILFNFPHPFLNHFSLVFIPIFFNIISFQYSFLFQFYDTVERGITTITNTNNLIITSLYHFHQNHP